MTDVMPEAPEALRHLNNNDSVTPLSPQQADKLKRKPAIRREKEKAPIANIHP